MGYRVETCDTREPRSTWFTRPPLNLCRALNMEAYHAGRGGQFDIFDHHGERWEPDPA